MKTRPENRRTVGLTMSCDCTECARAADNRHTSYTTLAAGIGGTHKPCIRVACYNAGNGRECHDVTLNDGRSLYEVPSVAIAERLLTEGGIIAATHTMKFC